MHLPCFWLWGVFVKRFKRISWCQKYELNKIIFSDQVDDPKTGFSRSCVKSLHLPKSEHLIEDHFKTKLRAITLQKGRAMNVLNISLSRASRTRKSFLSNSIDNNLSGKVLFQTAASPCCFPIFEHSCLFLREIFVCWRVSIFRIQI